MSTTDCPFCKIARRELPVQPVHETPNTLAFRDLHPQAPVHVLVIPKRHFATLNDMAGEPALLGEILAAGMAVARQEGIADAGYRAIFNCNQGAGQSVFHVHLHIMGGRALRWPPG